MIQREIDLLDEPSTCDLNQQDILLLVTEYRADTYEGSGYAYALYADGHIEEYNLGHCSCYGPFENSPLSSWENRKEFLRDMRSAIGHAGSQELCAMFAKAIRGIRIAKRA